MSEYDVPDDARNAVQRARGAVQAMETAANDYKPTDRFIPAQEHPNLDANLDEMAETAVESLKYAVEHTPGLAEDDQYFSNRQVIEDYVDSLEEVAPVFGRGIGSEVELHAAIGFAEMGQEAAELVEDVQQDIQSNRITKKPDVEDSYGEV